LINSQLTGGIHIGFCFACIVNNYKIVITTFDLDQNFRSW